jgi:hypothetical protein
VAKQKNTLGKKVLVEFLFWLHTIIILALLVAGLFIAWEWVFLILFVVKLQQWVFHGCILTLLETREGQIRKGTTFYQLAARRFLGAKLTRQAVVVVSAVQVAISLGVALAADLYNVRLHF